MRAIAIYVGLFLVVWGTLCAMIFIEQASAQPHARVSPWIELPHGTIYRADRIDAVYLTDDGTKMCVVTTGGATMYEKHKDPNQSIRHTFEHFKHRVTSYPIR